MACCTCAKQENLAKKRATLDAIVNIVDELKQEFEAESTPTPDVSFPIPCPNLALTDGGQPAMVRCIRVCKPKNASGGSSGAGGAGKKARGSSVLRLKQSKSRELRGGTLYVGCDCEMRNGLQDDCRRTECHGSPECLTLPSPTCGPSEFCNGKHLGKLFVRDGKTHHSAAFTDAGVMMDLPPQVSAGGGGAGGSSDTCECEYQCFAVEEVAKCCDCCKTGK